MASPRPHGTSALSLYALSPFLIDRTALWAQVGRCFPLRVQLNLSRRYLLLQGMRLIASQRSPNVRPPSLSLSRILTFSGPRCEHVGTAFKHLLPLS